MHTTNGLGGDTQDLLARHRALPIDARLPPGDREAAIRRRGLHLTILGVTLMGLGFLTSAGLVYIAGHATPAQRAFSSLAILAVLLGGAILTAVGLSEWQNRPMRSMQRQLYEEVVTNRARAQSVMDGFAQVSHAIDLIAEHMPEHDRIVNWRGYNAAVREDFTAQTGTDNRHAPSSNRGKHLGLVARDHDI